MTPTNQVNWIAERASCFIPNVFKDLREVVRRDVEEANRLSSAVAKGFRFSFEEDEKGFQFAVSRLAPELSVYPPRHVAFIMNRTAIRVDCQPHPGYPSGFFHVLPTWINENDEGRCVLTINEKPCEPWQISREALDHLVFPSQL